MLNVPLSVVTTSKVDPVALFFTVTEAPGITAPDESTTVPESEDRGPWPYAVALTVARRMMADAAPSRLCFMDRSLGAHTTRSGFLRQLRTESGATTEPLSGRDLNKRSHGRLPVRTMAETNSRFFGHF